MCLHRNFQRHSHPSIPIQRILVLFLPTIGNILDYSSLWANFYSDNRYGIHSLPKQSQDGVCHATLFYLRSKTGSYFAEMKHHDKPYRQEICRVRCVITVSTPYALFSARIHSLLFKSASSHQCNSFIQVFIRIFTT